MVSLPLDAPTYTGRYLVVCLTLCHQQDHHKVVLQTFESAGVSVETLVDPI